MLRMTVVLEDLVVMADRRQDKWTVDVRHTERERTLRMILSDQEMGALGMLMADEPVDEAVSKYCYGLIEPHIDGWDNDMRPIP